MFDAIIFDFDGTILDTESSSLEAWGEIYGEFEQEFPVDLWLATIGTKDSFDGVSYLENLLERPLDRVSLHHRFRRRDEEIIQQRRPMPGVLDRLLEAKTMGLKRAIASSSPSRWLNYHLPRLGLLFEFDAVRTRTDVGDRAKPDPAVFLAACEAVNVDPARAIALEDSLHGVVAAKKAGMKAVAIPNVATRSLDFSPADLVVESLAHTTIAEMIGRLTAGQG